MEVLFIPELTKTVFEKVIDKYIKNKDYQTAINYVNSLGSEIKGFDVAESIEKIEKAQKKDEVK